MTASPLTVEVVFVEALDQPERDRAAFVERRCGDDAALRAQVERLLAAHHRTVRQDFLEPPTVTSRARALRPAAKLGRYAILDELGHGGMGVVYEAYDRELERKVAVKQVLRGGVERLRIEAKALARLQHPNVVAVHDVGNADGELFIAMELVDGEPLSAWAKSHSPSELLRMLLDAGKGLAHAHREGILHRDFKPGNVLVDKTGRARVADFGLATDEELAERDSAPMGTPGFMAPEIVSGRPASVASDIYAYCRTLADLVVARPGAPHWLAPLVDRGLADAPGDRWARLDELLLAIERELGVDPQHDPRLGRIHRRRVAALVAVLVIGLPVFALAAGFGPTSLKTVFYLSLAMPVVFAIIVAVFWRAMTATAFNRRGVLTILIVILAITGHRGLALALDADPASTYCDDLLLFGFVFLGGSIYERDRLYVGATCIAGAIAVAVFPAFGAAIFTAVTVLQLPLFYLHWASKGAREAEVRTGVS